MQLAWTPVLRVGKNACPHLKSSELSRSQISRTVCYCVSRLDGGLLEAMIASHLFSCQARGPCRSTQKHQTNSLCLSNPSTVWLTSTNDQSPSVFLWNPFVCRACRSCPNKRSTNKLELQNSPDVSWWKTSQNMYHHEPIKKEQNSDPAQMKVCVLWCMWDGRSNVGVCMCIRPHFHCTYIHKNLHNGQMLEWFSLFASTEFHTFPRFEHYVRAAQLDLLYAFSFIDLTFHKYSHCTEDIRVRVIIKCSRKGIVLAQHNVMSSKWLRLKISSKWPSPVSHT